VKVILDTNVFVSGVFFSGPPFQILKAWSDGKIQLVISPEILDEYRQVGEILAEEHPTINFKPVLDYIVLNADIQSNLLHHFLSLYAMIPTMTNSSPAHW